MDKILLLEALRTIDIDAPSRLGICPHVVNYLNDSHYYHISCIGVVDFLGQYFESWPKFSGNPDYPVPHPSLPPREAFARCTEGKFNKDTEYGRNRRELLAFLIEQLEKELGN